MSQKMDVKFFKPFVEGTIKTLLVQCSLESKPGRPFYKKDEKSEPQYEIAGIIGLTCTAFTGSISLCFPKEVFLAVIGGMLGETYEEITEEMEDGAAELMNIIFGQAKRVLNAEGYDIVKAIPTVIRGDSIVTRHLTSSPTIVLPFDTKAGGFRIEISTESSM